MATLSMHLVVGERVFPQIRESAEIPDVLRYIPHHVLSRMWIVARPHALNGQTPESFYGVLERMGRSEAELQAARESHERYWEEAVSFVEEQEDIESIVASGVERSLEVVPRLWERGETHK